MTDRLVVVVNARPAPQGSKRHLGNGVLVESSKAVGPWREAVRAEAAHAAELASWATHPDQPLYVNLVFTLARPRAHYRTGRNVLRPDAPPEPTARPDLDKLIRATLDALTDAGVMTDDARVVGLTAAKTYPAGHLDALDTTGAVIVITQGTP